MAALTFATIMIAGVAATGSESLKAIVQSYIQIQAELAADKTEGIKAPARAIASEAATMGERGTAIAKAADSVEKAADIKSARDAFGTLTDAVMAAGKAEGWKDVEGVRLGFCPMVDRSWLQKGEKISNPYYGSQMLTCGEFKPLK